MDNSVTPFTLDVGLENIQRRDDPQPSLPAQRETQLVGDQVRQQVDELFGGASLNHTIRNLVTPHLTNPALLAPARFEARLRESTKHIRSMADTRDDPALQRAGDLLDHELNLRQLLANYRSMLMQA